jgi:hypothetical protein
VEFLLFLPFKKKKKKKKRGHSCPRLLLLFLYFTCFSVNITINKHLHKHASRFRHRRSNLFSSIAPPLDVLGVPCANVLSTTRHSWSTLCWRPSIHKTFPEYLVLASFHPTDVPGIPCVGVLPPRHLVAAKYTERKRILGNERIC